MPKIKTILTQLSRIDAKVMRDVIYTAEKFGSDHSLTLVFYQPVSCFRDCELQL